MRRRAAQHARLTRLAQPAQRQCPPAASAQPGVPHLCGTALPVAALPVAYWWRYRWRYRWRRFSSAGPLPVSRGGEAIMGRCWEVFVAVCAGRDHHGLFTPRCIAGGTWIRGGGAKPRTGTRRRGPGPPAPPCPCRGMHTWAWRTPRAARAGGTWGGRRLFRNHNVAGWPTKYS
jgi:hypothetical protein